MYYEGEYTTGEQALLGRGGALYYMPEEFDREIIWASNGLFTNPEDVIEAWTEGAGFMFISGHGSPNVWADHYPECLGTGNMEALTDYQSPPCVPGHRF